MPSRSGWPPRCAGTTRTAANEIATTGGRVFGVTALGEDLADARQKANRAAGLLRFDGAFFRSDIGHRVLGAAVR